MTTAMDMVHSYIRYRNDKGAVHCNLMMAKGRITLTKLTSITRLESPAAVVATKLSVLLKCEFQRLKW